MIRYGGALCIALGVAAGSARAETVATAPQIEFVISAVAEPDASGAAAIELRLLNSGSAPGNVTPCTCHRKQAQDRQSWAYPAGTHSALRSL